MPTKAVRVVPVSDAIAKYNSQARPTALTTPKIFVKKFCKTC